MAILNKLPGLEVTINVNGVPLQEYEEDSSDLYEASPGLSGEWQDARTVSRYIEAATDTEFSIVVAGEPEFERSSPSLLCDLYIDGKWVWGPIFTEPSLRKPTFRNETKGIYVSMPTGSGDHSLLKKFKFAKIETSELFILSQSRYIVLIFSQQVTIPEFAILRMIPSVWDRWEKYL